MKRYRLVLGLLCFISMGVLSSRLTAQDANRDLYFGFVLEKQTSKRSDGQTCLRVKGLSSDDFFHGACPAKMARLKAGDYVLSIDSQGVKDFAQASKLLAKAAKVKGRVRLKVTSTLSSRSIVEVTIVAKPLKSKTSKQDGRIAVPGHPLRFRLPENTQARFRHVEARRGGTLMVVETKLNQPVCTLKCVTAGSKSLEQVVREWLDKQKNNWKIKNFVLLSKKRLTKDRGEWVHVEANYFVHFDKKQNCHISMVWGRLDGLSYTLNCSSTKASSSTLSTFKALVHGFKTVAKETAKKTSKKTSQKKTVSAAPKKSRKAKEPAVCQKCQQALRAEAKFCDACGAKQNP